MEISPGSCSDMYEVEKIINSKTCSGKKYYLVKWLCYPINESTWEPKSNLKHLSYLINDFEREYPFSIDQNMYSIFCEGTKKKYAGKNKGKNSKESCFEKKLTSKKRKIEYFSELELNDQYLDKLKTHLHINISKKQKKDVNEPNDDLIVDLSSTATQFDEIINSVPPLDLNVATPEIKTYQSKLIMPIME